MHQIISSLY